MAPPTTTATPASTVLPESAPEEQASMVDNVDDKDSDSQENQREQEEAFQNKMVVDDSRVRRRNLKILTVVAVLGMILALILVIVVPKANSSSNSGEEQVVISSDSSDASDDDLDDDGIDFDSPTQPPQVAAIPPVPPAKEIQLLGGKYTTTRDVSSELSLAFDIEDMLGKEANDTQGQQSVYLSGSRAFAIDEDGNQVPRTLAELSLNAGAKMKFDPLYNFFRQAFLEVGATEVNESLGDFDDHPVEHYANTLVMDLFELKRGDYVETRSALVLNVWMAVAHELNVVLSACRRGESKVHLHAPLDRAVALWVGNGQEDGDNHGGFMLYHFAENAGLRFGQDPNILAGESKANEIIMGNFNKIQTHIEEKGCADQDEDSYVELRNMVDEIHGYMTVPLVQELIYSITQRQGDWTELYALAFLPRVAFCDPLAYDAMMRMMVRNDLRDEEMQDAFDTIEAIMGKCLHVTCDMLGDFNELSEAWFPFDGNVTTIITTPCEITGVDSFFSSTLAGYRLSDNVDKLSHIDNDIFQIRILLDSRAYDAALDYYMHGQNSRPKGELLSLRELATSDVRENVPTFSLYSPSFAHNVIVAALRRQDVYAEASNAQITEVVVGMLQSTVMYLSVLESLYIAIDNCRTKTDDTDLYGFSRKDFTDHFVHIWDVGAAFYIGSLEGPDDEGSDVGTMLFAVAEDFCSAFGTCANTDQARVNKNLVRALADGKNALALNQCDVAAKILEVEVVPELLIPLIQGTLFYAAQNAELEAGTTEGSLGAGFAFARSILPLVYDIDREAADVIARNTEFQLESVPIEDGIEAVYNALETTILTGELKVVMPMILSRNSATIQLTE